MSVNPEQIQPHISGPKERFESWERYRRDGTTYVVVAGLPKWVKDDTGKYVPYIYETQTDGVFVRSGLINWKLYRGNIIKADLRDPESNQKRAEETISLIDSGGDPIKLEYVDKFIQEGTIDEVNPKQEKAAALYVTQVYRVVEKLGDDLKKKNVKEPYVTVTYTQREGAPLSHTIEVKNFSREEVRDVHIVWNLADKVDQIRLHELEKKPETKDLTDKTEPYGKPDSVRILKGGKLWLHELTLFNKEKLQRVLASNKEIRFEYGKLVEKGYILDKNGNEIPVVPDKEENILLENAASYSFEDANEDGYIRNTDAQKYNVDPYIDMFITGSGTDTNRKRSYAEWNLGGDPQPIPAGSNVTYVKISFEVTKNSPYTCYYRGLMTYPPSTRTGTQLWGDINGGTFSVANLSATSVIGQNREVVLGDDATDAACVQLEDKLDDAVKWFAVGVMFATESSAREVKVKAKEYGANATPKPKLYVEFTPPTPP